MKNYDGVLKIDGEVGNKKLYDPRAYGKAAEAGMTARVVQACHDLRSTGTSLSA
jgi:fructose-bisphosphate aldolase class II